MYLVKALTPGTGPVDSGKLVRWAADQVRLVSDTAREFYVRTPEAFEVLAGPDFNDCLAAAVSELNSLRLPNAVQVITGAGAPTDYDLGVAATLLMASASTNNDLTFTAVELGVAAHAYSVTIVQGAGVSVPLSIVVTDGAALITLPTDGASAAVAKTASQIKTAWDASDGVGLMTVAVEGTGAGNVAAHAIGHPSGGVDTIIGTGAGVAGPGTLYIDITNKTLNINVGSAAESVWEAFTSA